MKLFLVLIFSFSILADFTSASAIEIVNTELSVDCDKVDLHQETNDEHNDKEHNHHCHCHTGHTHTAVTYKILSTFRSINYKSFVYYPPFNEGSLKDFISSIKRPPIS